MNNPTAILTGSHVYGTPREGSDVDLVVLMEPAQAADLARIMGVSVTRENPGNYPGLQFTVGGLNLIVETQAEKFAAWVEGTDELAARAPVTREEAVDVFDRLRAKA